MEIKSSILKMKKRDGRVVEFDPERIVIAVGKALKAAGSTDKAAVKAALPDVTYTGVSGSIAFDEQGRRNVPGRKNEPQPQGQGPARAAAPLALLLGRVSPEESLTFPRPTVTLGLTKTLLKEYTDAHGKDGFSTETALVWALCRYPTDRRTVHGSSHPHG